MTAQPVEGITIEWSRRCRPGVEMNEVDYYTLRYPNGTAFATIRSDSLVARGLTLPPAPVMVELKIRVRADDVEAARGYLWNELSPEIQRVKNAVRDAAATAIVVRRQT